MRIVFIVDCEPGEESISITSIDQEEMANVDPVLQEIKRHNGYYPTGDFLDYNSPTPEELYGNFAGFEEVESRLPRPVHGFKRIDEVHVFDNSLTLIM